MKIEAAIRMEAGEDSWFNSLTKEQQKEYLELHPNSKFTKQNKSKESAPNRPSTKPNSKPESNKRKAKKAKLQLNRRYQVTKDFVDRLAKIFKLKRDIKFEPSEGWKKIQNGNKKKQSAYGYWKSPDVWVSETRKEFEANSVKNKNSIVEDNKGRIVRH